MEAKFKKGQSVRITKRNGEVIDGSAIGTITFVLSVVNIMSII